MQLGRRISTALLGALLWAIPIGAQAQTGAVAGRVTDAASGAPISGATASLGDWGALTDENGRFIINNVPAGTHTLEIIAFGYATMRRPVTVVAGQTTTANYQLNVEAVALDNLVVIGYGEQQADELTGVIEEVGQEQFNTGRVVSPEELIIGKVAGVQIVESGEPGSAPAVRIRGGTSINASNDPLYVIDGVPLAVGGGISAGRNPLNFLNPNEIASMTILKDASATAIYGSRGANGVVLIETMSGAGAAATGGAALSYDGSISSSAIAGEADMLSTAQFRQAVDDYADNRLDLLGDADTDWRDLVTRNGIGHDHNVALSGAFESMSYRLSVGYLNQEGVMEGTTTERATVGINYGQNFFEDLLRVTANIKGARTDDEFTPGGVLSNAVLYAPTQPVRSGQACFGGFFEWTEEGDPCTGRSLTPVNPVAELELVIDEGTTYRSVGDIEAAIDMPFLTGLAGTVRLGYDVTRTSRAEFRPRALFGEARGPNPGYTRHRNFTQQNVLLDAFATYARRLEQLESDIDFTAGYSYEDGDAEYPEMEARGLEFDYLQTNGIPAAEEVRIYNWVEENRLISFFGRTNVNLLDRYLLTLSVRRDGSSRFGENEQWGTFPSAAFAWRVSEESFMDGVDMLSDLKLRASWGVNGNQAIPNYLAFSTYRLGEETAQYQFGDVFVPTIRPGAADPGIKWEETTSLNLGVDFGIMNNRFTGAIDWYTKETEDLIFRVPVAAGTNLTNFVTTNIGTLENSGLEFSLEALIFDGQDGDFWWSAGFNASTNDNELVSVNPRASGETILTGGIAGGVGNFIQVLRPGEPINSFYVYRHVRGEDGLPVWEDRNGDDQINEQDLYVDQNGDGTINQDDRVVHHSPQPDWSFGHSSRMGWGPIDASFTLRASIGNYVYNNVASNYGHYRALRYVDVPNNLHSSVLETGFESEQYFSDYYIEDASFLKMDNLTLGYTLDPFATGQTVRVFGTIQNVFTMTEYRGVDPLAGLNGIDNNLYPRSRTFIAGANVTF